MCFSLKNGKVKFKMANLSSKMANFKIIKFLKIKIIKFHGIQPKYIGSLGYI